MSNGTLDQTLEELTLASMGEVAIAGSLNATLDDATLASSGLVTTPTAGSLNQTLGELTATSAGAVLASGSLGGALGALTLSSTGLVTTPAFGTLSQTLDPLTFAATGEVQVSGTLAKTLGNLSLVSTGLVIAPNNGTLNQTLGALTLSALGGVSRAATLDATLGELVLQATGKVAYVPSVGTLSQTLEELTLDALGDVADISLGTLAATLGDLTLSALGDVVTYAGLAYTASVYVPASMHPSGDDRIYLLGGSAGVGGLTNAVYELDPDSGGAKGFQYAATVKSSIPDGTGGRTNAWAEAVRVDGVPCIIMFGGDGATGTTSANSRKAFKYNMQADAWTALPDMTSAFTTAGVVGVRNGHGVVLNDGRIMSVGGTGVPTGPIRDCLILNPSTNVWTAAASMITPRENHAVIKMPDGRILACGGTDGSSAHTSAEIYNPITNTWTAVAPMAHGRRLHFITRLHDGRIMVVGGDNGVTAAAMTSCEIFNPTALTWAPTGALPVGKKRDPAPGRNERSDIGLVMGRVTIQLPDTPVVVPPEITGTSRVLVVGGEEIESDKVYTWNQATGLWTTKANINYGGSDKPRAAHQMTSLDSGALVLTGGSGPAPAFGVAPVVSSDECGTKVLTFDVSDNGWTLVRDLPNVLYTFGGVYEGRAGHMVVHVPADIHPLGREQFYICGGTGPYSYSANSTTWQNMWALQVDPAANFSSTTRAGPETIWNSNYHWSGLIPSGPGGIPHIATIRNTGSGTRIRLMNLSTHAWVTSAPDQGSSFDYATGFSIGNGKLLFVSDNDVACKIYNSITNAWVSAASRNFAKQWGTGISLLDGRVLFAGGMIAGVVGTTTAEIYDPVTDTWTVTGSMSTARMGHLAEVLEDGKVLVVGGNAAYGDGIGITACEVFDPEEETWTPTGSIPEANYAGQAIMVKNSDRGRGSMCLIRNAPPIVSPVIGVASGKTAHTGVGFDSITINNTIDGLAVGDQLVFFGVGRGPGFYQSGGPTSPGWDTGVGSGWSTNNFGSPHGTLSFLTLQKTAEASDLTAPSWTFTATGAGMYWQAAVVALRVVPKATSNILGFSPMNWSTPNTSVTDATVHPHANITNLLGGTDVPRYVLTVSASVGGSVHSSSPPSSPVHTVKFYEALALGGLQIAELRYDSSQVSTSNIPVTGEVSDTNAGSRMFVFPILPL